MAKLDYYKRALEIVTEGAEAALPNALRAEALTSFQEAEPWAKQNNIQGFGIGEKITDGEMLKELSLRVYVDKKEPKASLDNPVPKKVYVPGFDVEVETDVVAIGKVELESNTSRLRPVIPGFSVGHPNISAGTFGCLVRKTNGTKTLYILSNSHVLADEGVANAGDDILQPGHRDGGRAPGDVIGELDSWVPFEFTDNTFPNLVDAAIAKVKKSDVKSAIRLIGVPKGVSTRLRRGMNVKKTGRTTDFTTGVIQDINYRLPLTYKKPGGGVGRVGLRDQVLCTRYTAGGDSGSAVLNSGNMVVGLHFAGSPSSSIFNKIEHVLTLLKIEIVTEVI